MGRKKRHKHLQQVELPLRSCRYQEWLDMVTMCEFEPPRQLACWERFFVNEERFLDAAETWLQQKLEGVVWPRIEDDVDKRLMGPARAAYQPWEWTAWDDEEASVGFAGAKQEKWYGCLTHWRQESLPLTPKIPAPSGLSGVDMATVF